MSSEFMPGRYTIGELIKNGTILGHKDGNFGSYYPKITDFGDVGVPLITAKVINNGRINFSEAQKLSFEKANSLPFGFIEENDVLLSHNATVGRVAIVPRLEGRVLIGTSLTYFRVNKERLLPHYLGAFFESRDFQNQLEAVMGLSTRNQVPITAQRLLTIEVPSLAVQTEIANCIQALDNRLNLLRETNATLEAIAQALFKSWFVDFDPVHANAGTQASSLPPEIQALFPATFTDSPQGPIPDGWDVLPFTETINVIGGGTPKTSIAEYWGGDIPWFSVVDAPAESDVFVIDTEKHITELGLNNSSTKLLPSGTTIISARGTVGRLALVGRDMAMNQSCYGLRGKYGDDYFTFFTTYRLVEALKQRSHGSVFDTITRDTLAGVSVIYPYQPVVMAFEDAVGPLMVKIKNNLQQANSLAALRDTLLPRLISGQLRLSAAKTALAEAG